VPTNEASLVKEARRGNEEAFLILYGRYRTGLFRFAWRMTGSVEVAEDVTQECFLTLARGSAFDPGRAPLQTYLLGIARHLIYRYMRGSQREAEQLVEPAAPSGVLDDLMAAERSEMVRQAIARLPELQREAIVLFEYEELSLEAIATITGAEEGAVKGRLQRARESLRKRLEPLLRPDQERKCS
jgi:RNA polymerase sigma-70 factor (ECF subfamily)